MQMGVAERAGKGLGNEVVAMTYVPLPPSMKIDERLTMADGIPPSQHTLLSTRPERVLVLGLQHCGGGGDAGCSETSVSSLSVGGTKTGTRARVVDLAAQDGYHTALGKPIK